MSQLNNLEKALTKFNGEIIEIIKVGPKKTRSAYRCLIDGYLVYIDPSHPYTVNSVSGEIETALKIAKSK